MRNIRKLCFLGKLLLNIICMFLPLSLSRTSITCETITGTFKNTPFSFRSYCSRSVYGCAVRRLKWSGVCHECHPRHSLPADPAHAARGPAGRYLAAARLGRVYPPAGKRQPGNTDFTDKSLPYPTAMVAVMYWNRLGYEYRMNLLSPN